MKSIFTINILVISLFTLIGCNNANNLKQKELEIREKEISIKEKAFTLKEKELSLVVAKQIEEDKIIQDLKNSQIVGDKIEHSNIENLIGFWFTPHAATLNIRFNRSGRFEFNDYNENSETEELLGGIFKLENGILTLMYDDRPKQSFKFYKGEKGDINYYIRKDGYYFVKGENGN